MTIRLAVCGGVYSNPYALRAFLADAERRGADRLFCLGDLGGFGAEPDAVWPLLRQGRVECIAGNYELAIGQAQPDCGCGYRDPTDNEFAQIMYDFTRAHTSLEYSRWMTTLPTERRERMAGVEVHLVHGSPLSVNDFWWESLPHEEHERRVQRSGGDLILCTHSGLPWQGRIGGALVVNVGVLGRPANDGTRDVWYAIVELDRDGINAELVQLPYDWEAQAASMRAAGLPAPFTETIETGWWTTCLEVLPPPERSRGRYHLYRSAVPALLDAFGLHDIVGSHGPPTATPVVPLFGTPLFPARLWLDMGRPSGTSAPHRPHLTRNDVRGIIDEAHAEGFIELAILGNASSGSDVGEAVRYAQGRLDKVGVLPFPELEASSSTGLGPDPARAIPELLVTGDGVYWCPAQESERAHPALVVIARDEGESMSLAHAKQRVVQRFLEYRRGDSTLAPVPICAA